MTAAPEKSRLIAMTFEQVVKHFGSAPSAAKALGVTRQAVYRWKEAGIPVGTQCRIQLLTGGVLQAEQAMSEAKAA